MATAAEPVPPRGAAGYAGALAAWALDVVLLAVGTGGVAALIAHRRALALLGVWAAGGLALAWARPARPKEPGARTGDAPLVLATLVLVPLLAPALAAWCERAGIAPLPGGPALRWTGVVLAAAGLALRIAGMRRLGTRFAPVIEVRDTQALETGGVYAWMRHPGYVGACVATLGAMLAFGSGAPLLLELPMIAATVARARREERALEARYGDEWRGYRARVGAAWRRSGARG
jgi:protein-S-isoprenylcysteine O-methyltransferase Ste14